MSNLLKGKHLLAYIFCLAFLFLDSCNPTEEQSPIEGAQQWFTKNLGTQWDAWPKNYGIQSIDWSNAVTNGSTLEIPVHLEQKVSSQYFNGKISSKNEISMRLAIWKEEDQYHAIAP